MFPIQKASLKSFTAPRSDFQLGHVLHIIGLHTELIIRIHPFRGFQVVVFCLVLILARRTGAPL
jgi:hypothetical protein